jgi:hypothetical protein
MGKDRKQKPPNNDSEPAREGLLAEIEDTGFVGMWKDRKDIGDSAEFARRLRKRAQAPTDGAGSTK